MFLCIVWTCWYFLIKLTEIYRKRGYSPCGMTLEHRTMLVRGECTSAIAIMSVEGIFNVHVTHGTTNGDTFYNFTEKYILPKLQRINPHSVLIMDNRSIHHMQEIVEMIEQVGAMLLFLPQYSPDLNPIELAFSKVKSEIKDSSMAYNDVETIMFSVFASITKNDGKEWISCTVTYTAIIT